MKWGYAIEVPKHDVDDVAVLRDAQRFVWSELASKLLSEGRVISSFRVVVRQIIPGYGAMVCCQNPFGHHIGIIATTGLGGDSDMS